MEHEVYVYKLGKRDLQSVSAKAAGHSYFTGKLAVLSVYRKFHLHQKVLHLLQETPLSAEARRQPPSPQSYPGRGKDQISTGDKTHPREHVDSAPRESKTSSRAQRDTFDQRTLNSWSAGPLRL